MFLLMYFYRHFLEGLARVLLVRVLGLSAMQQIFSSYLAAYPCVEADLSRESCKTRMMTSYSEKQFQYRAGSQTVSLKGNLVNLNIAVDICVYSSTGGHFDFHKSVQHRP